MKDKEIPLLLFDYDRKVYSSNPFIWLMQKIRIKKAPTVKENMLKYSNYINEIMDSISGTNSVLRGED